jgi:hypothetical protein
MTAGFSFSTLQALHHETFGLGGLRQKRSLRSEDVKRTSWQAGHRELKDPFGSFVERECAWSYDGFFLPIDFRPI